MSNQHSTSSTQTLQIMCIVLTCLRIVHNSNTRVSNRSVDPSTADSECGTADTINICSVLHSVGCYVYSATIALTIDKNNAGCSPFNIGNTIFIGYILALTNKVIMKTVDHSNFIIIPAGHCGLTQLLRIKVRRPCKIQTHSIRSGSHQCPCFVNVLNRHILRTVTCIIIV